MTTTRLPPKQIGTTPATTTTTATTTTATVTTTTTTQADQPTPAGVKPLDAFAMGGAAVTDGSALLLATLQRIGVADIKRAAGNVLEALRNAPLTRTTPEIEEAAKQVVAAFVAGDLSASTISARLASLDLSSPETTHALLQTIAARLEAVGDHVDGKAALAAVSNVLLPRIQAPVASLLAARDLAPLGELAPYSLRASRGVPPDLYSNEPGLNALLSTLGKKDGAVVGVGGAVLDAASRLGSSMIIAVDQDPRIAQGIEVVVGILAAVDASIGATADKDVRKQAVLDRMNGKVSEADVRKELVVMGVSASTLAALPSLLKALNVGAANSVGGKVSDVWSRSDDAADRIEHLTKLAREGRIVAFAGDLSDPDTAAHVNNILEARGEQVGYFQLSNVLDWVADTRALTNNVGKLHFRPDAVVATTTMLFEDGDALRAKLVPHLGSHEKPLARPASEWFGETGLGEKLHAMLWSTTERRGFYQQLMSRFLRGSGDSRTDPESIEKLRAFVDAALDEKVSHASFADQLSRIASNSGLTPILKELGLGETATLSGFTSKLDIALTRRNLPAALDAYLSKALTTEGKVEFLRNQLGDVTVSSQEIQRVASEARDLVELERGLASLRRAAGSVSTDG